MSIEPLTDVELDALDDISPMDFKNLRESYRALRVAFSLSRAAQQQDREALRIAQAVRDDARADSQRQLKWRRELAPLEVELTALRAELAGRTSKAEQRERDTRVLLIGVAGTIAGGIHRCGTIDSPEVLATIAKEAVALARAVVSEVDHFEPRSKP